MKLVGPIKQFDTDNRLFSMIIGNRVKYFYLQRNLMKKYSKYLYEGRFVTLEVGDDSKIVNNYKAYRVDHFLKIYKQTHREQLVYYDINKVKNQIGDFLNVEGYRMFLDLEMSMHPYYRTKTFKQEIIQAGIVIEDDNGVVETLFDS